MWTIWYSAYLSGAKAIEPQRFKITPSVHYASDSILIEGACFWGCQSQQQQQK